MKRIFIGGLSVLALFVVPSVSEGASLYIDPAISELYRGDSVTMSVRLDTDEEDRECINAVDAVINYSDNIDPVDVTISDSIFNIWVEKPTIDKTNRTISFAGGIPNGYCGRVSGDPRLTNVLAKIIFRSPGFTIGQQSDSNVATIEFADTSTAYLNDGRGTKANLLVYPAKITLNKNAGTALVNPWQDEISADKTPPEKFSIDLVKGDGNFSNKYYIVFNTIDKQTGIDHYEVIEEPASQFGSFKWGRADAPWIESPSPYILKDQSLNSIIRVKAIDKAGNEYVATYAPEDSLKSLSYAEMMLIIVLVTAVGFTLVIAWFIARYFLKRKTNKSALKNNSLGDLPTEIQKEDNADTKTERNKNNKHD